VGVTTTPARYSSACNTTSPFPQLNSDEELVQAGLLGIPKKRPLATFSLCLVYGLAVFAAGSYVAKLLA
jgi:hypothetical protein